MAVWKMPGREGVARVPVLGHVASGAWALPSLCDLMALSLLWPAALTLVCGQGVTALRGPMEDVEGAVQAPCAVRHLTPMGAGGTGETTLTCHEPGLTALSQKCPCPGEPAGCDLRSLEVLAAQERAALWGSL